MNDSHICSAGCKRGSDLNRAFRNLLAKQRDPLHQPCPQLSQTYLNSNISGKFTTQFEASGFETWCCRLPYLPTRNPHLRKN